MPSCVLTGAKRTERALTLPRLKAEDSQAWCWTVLTGLPDLKNIQSSVDITVNSQTAMRTIVDTNRQIFRDSGSALGAELRGVSGWHFNYYPGSFFRFPAQYLEEPEPRHIPHRPVQSMIQLIFEVEIGLPVCGILSNLLNALPKRCVPRVHFLNVDGVIVADKTIRHLEMEVSPLVVDFIIGFSEKDTGFIPAVRAFYSTGEHLLPHSENILGLLKEAGIAYLNTIRSSKKGLAAYIYANSSASWRQWPQWHIITREAHIPLATRIFANSDRLYVSVNRARQPELESADIPNSEIFTFKSPTRFFEGETIIAVPPLEAGKTWLVTILDPTKEASIGFIQPLNHLLKNLRANLLIFGEGYLQFGKLLNLTKAGYRTFVLTVNSYTLLKSSVIEIATEFKPMVGCLKSLRVSLKTIFECLSHLSSTILSITDLLKGVCYNGSDGTIR